LEKAKDNSPLAIFEQLFHVYHARLHYYAFTMLKDPDAADDVVQLVFKKLWEKRDELLMEGAIKGYLYKATHNLCLNYIRDNKIRKRHTSAATAHTVNVESNTKDKVITGELTSLIHEVMGDLPPQCRLVFVKSRMEGKKYADIAREMDISVKTVEAQIGKALKIFRARLADYLVVILIIGILI
jgi:RNA polymerase sigma-70 factor (ECF subfamily)